MQPYILIYMVGIARSTVICDFPDIFPIGSFEGAAYGPYAGQVVHGQLGEKSPSWPPSHHSLAFCALLPNLAAWWTPRFLRFTWILMEALAVCQCFFVFVTTILRKFDKSSTEVYGGSTKVLRNVYGHSTQSSPKHPEVPRQDRGLLLQPMCSIDLVHMNITLYKYTTICTYT